MVRVICNCTYEWGFTMGKQYWGYVYNSFYYQLEDDHGKLTLVDKGGFTEC